MIARSALAVAPDLELDGWLERFEDEAASGHAPNPADFLPDPSHPKYGSALREMLRLDLEFAWSRGEERQVEDYATRFPQLFKDPNALAEVAVEEYRLRRAAGEDPDPAEYQRRLGVELPVKKKPAPDGPTWDGEGFPRVGGIIAPGYRLLSELGRGAFGRVYLAEQADLANRKVAVKVSSRLIGEAQTLAKLQHTHIVPIYGVHRVGKYQVLVMPYLGAATLADVIAARRDGQSGRLTERSVRTVVAPRSSSATPKWDEEGSKESRDSAAALKKPPAPQIVRQDQNAQTDCDALPIGVAIADALAHAHGRGILHRDVKPANILLTDDGAPMLLDFNLAADETERAASAGGTPRYMSPEQIEAMTNSIVKPDARSDVYSLGLVLHELIAAELPFPERSGPWESIAPAMLTNRQQPQVRLASPAITAILRKCLEPNPANRYQSAADLRDDLVRQRNNQTLKVAHEPLSRERFRKWRRRHPRLSSATTVGTAALVLVTAVALTAYWQWNRVRDIQAREAHATMARTRDQVHRLEIDLRGPVEPIREAHDKALVALASYGLPADENWNANTNARRLPAPDAEALRRDVAFVLFCAAESAGELGARATDAGRRTQLFDEALFLNARAGEAYPSEQPIRLFLQQRQVLLDRAGRTEEAKALTKRIESATNPSAATEFLQAHFDQAAGRYREAATALEQIVSRGRANYTAWMELGVARLRLHKYEPAAEAFLAAAALEPEEPRPLYYRGLALLSAGRFDRAVELLDRYLDRQPNEAEAWLNRALVRIRLKDGKAALDNLPAAERLGGATTRLYALREMAFRLTGQAQEAAEQHRLMLSSTPASVDDWTIRGEERLISDAAGALKDFDEALAIDPEAPAALRGKASALSEKLNRPADAATVLDRLVAGEAATAEDRAGYAVLLARLGRKDEARKQARACLAPETRPLALYQAASALAVLAATAHERAEVIAILRRVIQGDAAWAKDMAGDSDLKSVQSESDFKALLEGAKVLNGGK
ncbi:MAG TPA: protein kinase [Gemmataceae bacterium]|jgi:serine/threonine protein kinase/Flp pilus assembly protein TadD|nr:protein kinase [Gemmataceae bacterium]